MNFIKEEIKRRSLSLNTKILTKDLTLNKDTYSRMIRSNSYLKERNIPYIPLGNVYTSICKNFYPLIMKVDYEKIKKICNRHYRMLSFYCFTCQIHFCIKCQSEHLGHSFISFDEIEVNEKDIVKEENLINKKISLLFKQKINKKTDKKTYEFFMKLKNEVIRFNYFIIDAYKRDKNNFYNFYNYYYLYKLKEDLKSDRNDLLKKFFGLHGFKMMINNLKFFYEKQKYKWLLKNLINYKKNEIKKEKLKKREETYEFNNLDILIQNEGFNEKIINKMKEIIIEVKNRDDLKKKIFKFIISAIDVFKTSPDKFLQQLNTILEQVKINFKEMVRQNVGNTEDVEKYEIRKFIFLLCK